VMGKLFLMAVGTLRDSGRGEKVVRTAKSSPAR
jgi:hypothetical protein